MPENNSHDEFVKVIKSASDAFVKVSTVVVSCASIGYIIGWREQSAFFATINAPWAMGYLTHLQILGKGIASASITAIFFLAAIYQVATGMSTRKSLVKWSLIWLVVGVVTLIFSFFVSSKIEILLNFAVMCFWSIALALNLGEMVASLMERDGKWTVYETSIAYSIIFAGVIGLPWQMANMRAKSFTNGANENKIVALLPSTTNSAKVEAWVVVEPVGEKLLLMSPKTNSGTIFKLVDTEGLSIVKLHAVISNP